MVKVLMLGVGLCLLGVSSGCGSGSEDEGSTPGRAESPAYWTGERGAFCGTRLPTRNRSDGAAAGLVLERAGVAPGEVLAVRIRNSGRETLTHGPRPIAYRWAGGQWEPISTAEPGEEIVVPAVAYLIRPGSTGGCNELPIPRSWQPGRYRIIFELELADPDGENVMLRPRGYFRVVAPKER